VAPKKNQVNSKKMTTRGQARKANASNGTETSEIKNPGLAVKKNTLNSTFKTKAFKPIKKPI